MAITPAVADELAPSAADPFRYGWRYIHHSRPEGGIDIEQVPLTLEDLLHPEEGDQVTHSKEHQRICKYLINVLEARLTNDPAAVVLDDVRVAWDVLDLRPHGPDIAVIFGVREQRNWSTFDVAEEGVRPAMIIEVTSSETRQIDLIDKVEEYDIAGVPFYFIVDIAIRRGKAPRRIWGYRSGPEGYVPLTADERGWIWMEPVALWIGIRDDHVECFDQSGQALGDYTKIDAARAEAETRAAVAEDRVRVLEEELRRLRGEDRNY